MNNLIEGFQQRKDYKVKSVAKAMILLNLLAEIHRSASLQEIAQATGWPKSTIHALLSTMAQFSVVSQDSVTGEYRLGMRLFELGNGIVRDWDILGFATPKMKEIMLQTNESVNLGMRDRNEVLIIEHIDSGNPLRVMVERGTRLPLHSTAMGKVILSSLPKNQVQKILKETGLPAFTPHTIANTEELEKELDRIRENGYAVENGELRVGMRGVAAAIYDAKKNTTYAIGITGMFRKTSDDSFILARDLIVRAAEQISAALERYP